MTHHEVSLPAETPPPAEGQVGETPSSAGARERLPGDLVLPDGVRGVVLFAHGSGSSRLSTRNRWVAGQLHAARLGTLLMDLLTAEEGRVDARTAQLRFDIPLLVHRVLGAVDWLAADERTSHLPLGLFGASTGASAALGAESSRPGIANAIVSRGGRPDMAPGLGRVRAPTLLVVGGRDEQVIQLNEQAARQLTSVYELRIVEGAPHLFEEPGALEEVATAAADWFDQHLS